MQSLTKPAIRQRLLSILRALSQDAQHRNAEGVKSQFLSLDLPPYQTIAAYFPSDGELDPMPLLLSLMQAGKTCYFPTVTGENLVFRSWSPGEPRVQGPFGLWEPAPDAPSITPEKLDLILVPLVGFDARCQRLGRGKGYYDRFLMAAPQAITIGLAHECQYVPELPVDPWDHPLNRVISEQKTR